MNVKSKLSLTYAHGVCVLNAANHPRQNSHCSGDKGISNSNESFFSSMTSPGLYSLLIKILLQTLLSFSFLRIHIHPLFGQLYINWSVAKDCMWGKWILLPIIITLLQHHLRLIIPLWVHFHIRINAMTQDTRRSMHKKAAFHPLKHSKQMMMLCFKK